MQLGIPSMAQLSKQVNFASLWKCLGVGITTRTQTMKACIDFPHHQKC